MCLCGRHVVFSVIVLNILPYFWVNFTSQFLKKLIHAMFARVFPMFFPSCSYVGLLHCILATHAALDNADDRLNETPVFLLQRKNMDTQLTSNKEPELDSTRIQEPPDIQPAADTTLITSFQPPSGPVPQPSSPFYVQDGDDDEDAISSEFAPPFQLSSAMPPVANMSQQGTGPAFAPTFLGSVPHAGPTKTRRSLWLKIALVASVVVVVLGFLWVTVFAQPTGQLATTNHAPAPTARAAKPGAPTGKPTPLPTTLPGQTTNGAQNGMEIPQQLPAGWTNAGLTIGDAIFAERTAWTFTDREEGLDFRNIGTRAQHGGTMTASTFILSPGGKLRFEQNDVRVANNILFDKITSTQLIQAAVNIVPSLVMFQAQGQNQFAWVDVSYQLFQSQLDPNNPGQRTEGLEMDSAAKQPRTHHMMVLLLRVTPGTQGADAPMGGSGWLVSNYGLDLNDTPLDILQPV
jgi:hypothetical protein